MERKIAFISEHASPLAALGGVDSGGQNVYVGELAKHLVNLGYSVDIFTRHDDARLPEIIEWTNGIRVIHIKAGPVDYIKKEELLPHMAEFTENMTDFIHRFQPGYKLVHAHFFMSGLVAAELKKKMNIPFIITFHALGKVRKLHQKTADTFPEERDAIEERIVQEAEQIIAECPQDREDLIQLYNANPEKITIIPCGFNPAEFHPIDTLLARSVLNLDPKEHIILQLGRMVPRKGIENVVRAAGELNKLYPGRFRLVVVGGETDDPDPRSTPEINRLYTIAESLGVADKVTFVGRKSRDKLKYYYASADVFVTTPWYEPFGITPLESMACGTPVIGSNVGGIKYSVVDGKTGFLVDPHDETQLATKLKDTLQNRKLLEYLKSNALHRANTYFTWAKIANAMANVYEELLSQTVIDTDESLSIIERSFDTAAETLRQSREVLRIPILDAAYSISRSLENGGKMLIAGNGGSAADAQHFAAELVGQYIQKNRPALPVISLTADTALLTAWSNDYSYDDVFSRQVEAFGQPGDIMVGISTSGQSNNVINAFKTAKERGMVCIALIGKGGGAMHELADISILVPSYDTPRIQEVHINVIHMICDIIEKQLFAHKITDRDETQLLDLLQYRENTHFLRAVKPS